MDDKDLSPEVRLLVKTMSAFNLGFDQVAEFIGISGNTVRRWVRGDFQPNPTYRKMIAEAVVKMRKTFGVEDRFDYLDLASEEEQEIHLELTEIASTILSAVMPQHNPSAKPEDAKLFAPSWPGFSQIYRILRLRKVWGPPKHGAYGRPSDSKRRLSAKGRLETKTFPLTDVRIK